MFRKGHHAQERLEQQIKDLEQRLEGQEAQIRVEGEEARERDRANAELEARCAQLRLERGAASGEAEEASRAADRLAEEAERLGDEVERVRARFGDELREADRALAQEREARAEVEQAVRLSEQERRDGACGQKFVDISIDRCEFANAFSYFMTMQLRGGLEVRRTDVSEPSARPVFKRASFLLPVEEEDHLATGGALKLAAFVRVANPAAVGAEHVERFLGEAQVQFGDLQVLDGETASKRVVRDVTFVRTADQGGGASSKELDVGRATVALQLKALTPAEVCAAAAEGPCAAAHPMLPGLPSLNKSLWTAAPLQSCLRVLVHWASALPPPLARGRAEARVVLRLLCSDGRVLHESPSSYVAVVASSGPGAGAVCEANFGQEVLLPLRAGAPKELLVQLALDVVSMDDAAEGAAHSASVLDLRWHPEALPALAPLHVFARPCHRYPARARRCWCRWSAIRAMTHWTGLATATARSSASAGCRQAGLCRRSPLAHSLPSAPSHRPPAPAQRCR